MKKIFALFYSTVFSIGTLFADGLAVYVEGIYYNLNRNDQTAAVSYPGSIPTGGVYIGNIDIPSSITYNDTIFSVTSIGREAFENSTQLYSVTIPNSVITIEDEAFAKCTYLRQITIPNSVTTIKKRAFYDCKYSLTSITIPNSVTSIGEEAFYGCHELKSAKIGNGVTNIGKKAFYCGLREVMLYATIPPTINYDLPSINSGSASTFTPSVVIYIPCGSLEAYMASNWQYYKNIQYNSKVFNVFNVDIASSDSLLGSVSLDWENDNNCNTLLNLSATSNAGYKFIRWSDGNIENPRTIVLKTDISLSAEFAIAKSGICGKNDQLSWAYEDKTKTLTICGNGELTENCFFGLEAPKEMQNLYIGEKVTAIGDSAFYAMTTLRHLSIGSGMTSIGKYTFAECKNIDDITCYATTAPTITYETFANIGNKYYVYLFIPEGSQRSYKRDYYWCQFDVQAIRAQQIETTEVTTTQTENSVNIKWPSVTDAATYELVIKDKNSKVICTLIFNAQGQLTEIAYNAPSRDSAPQQSQAAGFSYTITGLEPGTSYNLTITAKNANGQEIDKKYSSFHTNWPQAIEDIHVDSTMPAKVLVDGRIYILRGEHVYDAEGKMVK